MVRRDKAEFLRTAACYAVGFSFPALILCGLCSGNGIHEAYFFWYFLRGVPVALGFGFLVGLLVADSRWEAAVARERRLDALEVAAATESG
jgi:hypothetical protein